MFSFVTHPGAKGVSWGPQVCGIGNRWKVNFNKGYGPNDCTKYQEQCDWWDWWCWSERWSIDCSPINRIARTAQVWFLHGLISKYSRLMKNLDDDTISIAHCA